MRAGLLGEVEPRVSSVPPFGGSAGGEAADLAAAAGLVLDPWERLVLGRSLGEGSDGRWAAFEVGVIVARQNGKGAVLEARELAGLFLFGEQLIMHSAHEFKTAQEAFRRILALVENSDFLRRRCKRPRTSHGEEGIELLNGNRLRFVARSTGSGRGFSGDTVILDEAFNLPEAAIAALMPTMSARPNPQLWYTSSAVNQKQHANGQVLARVRRRGFAGGDPGLAFFEWSVDEDRYRKDPVGVSADPGSWAQANPNLGRRIGVDHVAREHRSMSLETFAVERLSVGDWPTDESDADEFLQAWMACADVESAAVGRPVFGVDVSPGSQSAAIVAATRRSDGLPHVEVVEHRPRADWVPARCAELRAAHEPLGFVLDPAGPVGSLLADLVGVEPVEMATRDMGQACEGFSRAVTDGQVRHLADPILTQALSGAGRRDIGDGLWAWSRRRSGTDICPLVAATEAVWRLAAVQDYDLLDSVL